MSMDKTHFTTSDTNLVVNTGSKVLLHDIVSFTQDGKTVGKLDATIDFSDLSPELHMNAIQILQKMPVSLMLAVDEVPPTTVRDTYPPEPKVRVNQWPHAWQRVKGWFRNGE